MLFFTATAHFRAVFQYQPTTPSRSNEHLRTSSQCVRHRRVVRQCLERLHQHEDNSSCDRRWRRAVWASEGWRDSVALQLRDGRKEKLKVQSLEGENLVATTGQRYSRGDIVELKRKSTSPLKTTLLIAGVAMAASLLGPWPLLMTTISAAGRKHSHRAPCSRAAIVRPSLRTRYSVVRESHQRPVVPSPPGVRSPPERVRPFFLHPQDAARVPPCLSTSMFVSALCCRRQRPQTSAGLSASSKTAARF